MYYLHYLITENRDNKSASQFRSILHSRTILFSLCNSLALSTLPLLLQLWSSTRWSCLIEKEIKGVFQLSFVGFQRSLIFFLFFAKSEVWHTLNTELAIVEPFRASCATCRWAAIDADSFRKVKNWSTMNFGVLQSLRFAAELTTNWWKIRHLPPT